MSDQEQEQKQESSQVPEQPQTQPTAAPASEPVGLRVSLIPSEEQEKRDIQAGFKLWYWGVIVGASALVVAVGLLWLRVFLVRADAEQIRAQAEDFKRNSEQQLKSFQAAKAIQEQVKILQTLLKSHRYTTNVFKFFEQHTLTDVQYKDMSIAEDGVVSVTALTTGYDLVAQQLVEFKNAPMVTAVTVSGLKGVTDDYGKISEIDFNMSVTLDKSIFNYEDPQAVAAKADEQPAAPKVQ